MIDQVKVVDAWNRRISTNSAHITIDGKHLSEGPLFQSYKTGSWGYDYTDHVVADYGCGGGHFGRWLFQKFIPKNYIAFDIAERSLAAARATLAHVPEGMKEFTRTMPDGMAVRQVCADVLVCFSVIQHIADKETLEKLLGNFNWSGCDKIFLTCKWSAKTRFQAQPYKSIKEIASACLTNAQELSAMLGNYKLIRYTKPEKEGVYQYCWFDLVI